MLRATNAKDSIVAVPDAQVQLFHNNVKTFETTSNGITVQGPEGGTGVINLYADEGDDNADKWHFLANTDGTLLIRNLSDGSWDTNIKCVGGGAAELYHDDAIKLATTSSGATVTGDLVTSGNIDLADSSGGSNNRIKLGTGDDLQVYHDGSNGYVYNSGSGNLTLVGNGNNRVQIRAKNGENSITCNSDGNVELYYDNSKKYETVSNGAILYGVEGGDANLYLYADEGDDNADKWLMQSESDGFFALKNYASGSWETSIKATGNGAVELYDNDTWRLKTTGVGAEVNGEFTCGGVNASGEFNMIGNGAKYLDFFTLANSNTVTYRHHNPSGNGFETFATFTANGAGTISFDGVTKFATRSDGFQLANGSGNNKILIYNSDFIQCGHSNDGLRIYLSLIHISEPTRPY